MRHTVKRSMWAVTGLVVAAVAVVWIVAWRSPPYYEAPPARLRVPILTMAEYDELSQVHPRPANGSPFARPSPWLRAGWASFSPT